MKRAKPDLGDGIGAWVNPEFLPRLLRGKLRRILTAQGIDAEVANAFLQNCGEWVQQTLDDQWLIGPGIQRDQLQKIAANTDRLLQSLTLASQQTRDSLQLQSELVKESETARHGIASTVLEAIKTGKPDRTVQSVAWDFVEALGIIAERAAAQLDPSRQGKPDHANAQHLTAMIVDTFYGRFGYLPPSDKDAWFAGFMAELGEACNLPCGPRITRAAVKAKEADLTLIGKESGSA